MRELCCEELWEHQSQINRNDLEWKTNQNLVTIGQKWPRRTVFLKEINEKIILDEDFAHNAISHIVE